MEQRELLLGAADALTGLVHENPDLLGNVQQNCAMTSTSIWPTADSSNPTMTHPTPALACSVQWVRHQSDLPLTHPTLQ